MRPRLCYGNKWFLAWANTKITFVDEILAMVEKKDGHLVAAYKQLLPVVTIVYS